MNGDEGELSVHSDVGDAVCDDGHEREAGRPHTTDPSSEDEVQHHPIAASSQLQCITSFPPFTLYSLTLTHPLTPLTLSGSATVSALH